MPNCRAAKPVTVAIPAGTEQGADASHQSCGRIDYGVWFKIGPFPDLKQPTNLVLDTLVNGACVKGVDEVGVRPKHLVLFC
jgi:hypothetical protein